MAGAEPIPRYVTVLSWPYSSDRLQLAEDCLSAIVEAARHHPPPHGFDLLISTAKNIHGQVLLLVVELGYDGAPANYDSRFFSPLGNWLLDKVGQKWQERDILHIIDSPLNEYFRGFDVWRSVHVSGTDSSPHETRAFSVAVCLFDPSSAREESMRRYVGKGAQYAIIHREVLSAIAQQTQRPVSENAVLGISEGSLFGADSIMGVGNLGVFRMHCARSNLLFCVKPEKIQPLLAGPSGQFEFEPYVLFLRMPSCVGQGSISQSLAQTESVAGLTAVWECPDHYSLVNNFVYLSRELLLNLSVFVNLSDASYRWFGGDIRVEDSEMAKLGYHPMPQDR